jgi:hypothetical protein
MRVSVGWAVLLTVGFAGTALAQGAGAPPRISVAPVHGDKNNAVGSQVNAALCKVYDCVPFAAVSTKKKPDWKKAKKAGVAAIFTTTITKSRKGYTAGVALLMGPSRPKQTWNLPLTSHRNLSGAELKQVVRESGPSLGLAEDVGGAAAIAATESARTPAPPVASNTPSSPMSTEPPPPETMPILPPPGASGPGDRTLADTPVTVDATPSTNVAGVRGQPLFTIEVGGDFLNRYLSYTPDGTPLLLTYKANLIAMLYAGIEFFPFAKTGSFLAGLGIFGNYTFSLGLKSQQPTGGNGTQDSSSFSMLSAGLEARIRPIKYSDFAIVIPVAFRTYQFAVDNAAVDFPRLPTQHLVGLSAGLKLEIPLGSWFVILLGGDYVFWFQQRQLIANSNPTYFPSGSAGALELELGFGIYIVGPLSVRLLGQYANTSYSLNTDPTVPYSATGASDRLFGGRATVRLEF